MNVELIEIRDFLAGHPPFDHLPGEVLERLPRYLSVRYLRRGTPLPPPDADGDYLYIIRKGAVELRDQSDELIGKIGEGEIHASACRAGSSVRFTALTVEDSLFYLLPCERLETLREQHPEFAEHFNQSVRDRLRRALESIQAIRGSHTGLLNVPVGGLIVREPVVARPETPIGKAARLMTEARVSSLLIMEDERLVGIMTDRDLRSRCLAKDRDPGQPVSEIMTRRLHKVEPETRGFEALITMTRLSVHHLPVIDHGRVIGVVSSNDLIRYQSANAVYLAGDIRRCTSVEALTRICADIPELQVQMIASGATGYHVGQTISSITEAITRRLIELCQEQLGPPPVSFAWLAVGSLARREQTVHSDQDHALLLADDFDPARHDGYFESLARFVADGLNACGFTYCPGEVMATNPEWRQPCRVWRRYFDLWITRPEKKALMLASNFFDMRTICGDPALYEQLHAEVLQQTHSNRIFLAHLAANALKNRPPLGFFRHFVLIGEGDHAQSLDLKRRAIIPAVDLARVYALSAGLPEVNTRERLKIAAETSALSHESAENLEDAFEFIVTLRARHQAEQIKRGEKPDNYMAPSELSSLERGHLKDAFSVISGLQNALGQRHQAGRFF
ncbi:putative nucleotidyltransferase substrate binding domain-containing protein [Thiohalomonas denitrificans]|uniref:CBS domain-containing protein n=1 Tax=Thiohalomonas denitrificans TaxID=415747 RepID=A0A1G5PIP7_9GAMM|nr:putative nucleotidyltransferase substrate binding domain-containing protein [Thiohalomonas denitrificans]SCZ49374.1 CBS domain-containing protein [Thiohalomonas denitrificans]